ncbi:MAG: hypothetical protein DRP01_04865 [Archaeoglobales archaeon]|nr:MAG: hypothetical protein DRP01_04865 [Archaeoglobales archaeon]
MHEGEDLNGAYKQLTYFISCTDGRRRVVIRYYGEVDKDSPVWVSCSCPDFKFRWEVSLAHRNNTSIIYSNGAYPKITNPQLQPGVCKHVFRCAVTSLGTQDVPDSKKTEPNVIRRVLNRLPKAIQELVGSSNVLDRRENREKK